MRVYVETNFLVEMALTQEESNACEAILSVVEAGSAELIIPAFSIPEAYHSIVGKHLQRIDIGNDLGQVMHQLMRSNLFTGARANFEAVTQYLAHSTQEEEFRFHETVERIIRIASRVIPLTTEVLQSAAKLRAESGLELGDSVVLASVLSDLTENPPSECCFVTRDSDLSDDPDIRKVLRSRGCELKPQFGAALGYLRSRIGNY
jgi:predicted nucleic acid-binding protein